MIKICPVCSKEYDTRNHDGKTCSKSCGITYRSEKQKATHPLQICVICGITFPDKNYTKNKTCSPACAVELKKLTSIEKYGVTNAAKNSTIKCIIKKTNIERYGCSVASQSVNARKKIKANRWDNKTKEELHTIALKKENTNIKKYGVKNVFQNNNVKEKSKNTNIKKLGVAYPMQADSVKKKSKETCIEKYGVDNIGKVEETKISKKNTCIQLYGVPNQSQKNISIETLAIFNNKEKLTKLYSGNKVSCVYLGNLYGVSASFVLNKLKQYNIPIENPTCSCYENEIFDFIKAFNIPVIRNKRNILVSKKEIDIFMPDKKIGIEFNGLFWHNEYKQGKEAKTYHLNKTINSEEKNIHLIHIFEDDWVYKKDIVKSRILNLLGKNTIKIYARYCSVRKISYLESSLFLNKYHLLGSHATNICLGLFYKDLLVSCMTFCPLRLSLNSVSVKNNYELLRFCSKGQVVGGASKLFSYFLKTYKPTKVVSYADRHWTSTIKPNVYDMLGFKKVSDGKPNYWYIIGDKREHRFNWRKSVLSKKLSKFDPSLTEYQNMLKNGYDRIWGCGSLKYEYLNK